MTTTEHATLKEWLHLAADGGLSPRERMALQRHLPSCAECRREAAELERMDALLESSAVPVRPGFAAEVMAGLPAAGWENRTPGSWRVAAALAAVLVLVSGVLGFGALSGPAPRGVGWALFDLLRSALAAGSGLLAASWNGLGLAVSALFAGSKVAFAAFVVVVVGVDLLFLRLLARRRVRALRRREVPRTNGGR